MSRFTKGFLASGAALALSLGAANAAHVPGEFVVNFDPLNGSGVSGGGTISYDADDQTLSFNLTFMGLDAGPHPMHVHGLFEEGVGVVGGTPADSVTPDMSFDSDGDGYVETLEGVPAYGDILLQLTTSPGDAAAFVMADDSGMATYNVTFDLSDSSVFLPSPATGNVYGIADLFPLVLREIVIHGLIVPTGDGDGTGFEIDGDCSDAGTDFATGDPSLCYVALLPVASAEIMAAPVPLPGAALFFVTAGLAGGAARLRRGAKG